MYEVQEVLTFIQEYYGVRDLTVHVLNRAPEKYVYQVKLTAGEWDPLNNGPYRVWCLFPGWLNLSVRTIIQRVPFIQRDRPNVTNYPRRQP